MGNPWKEIVGAHECLNSARNYLNDAMGAVMAEERPATQEQAEERMAEVEGFIRYTERELDRAKRTLDMDNDTPERKPAGGDGT